MTKDDGSIRAAIEILAAEAGVNLHDERVAIATGEPAYARKFDGSLEAELFPSARGVVYIHSPRSPSICIELVDHQRDLAPPKAIYMIRVAMPDPSNPRQRTELNGDLSCIFVGPKGILLDNYARRRARELPDLP